MAWPFRCTASTRGARPARRKALFRNFEQRLVTYAERDPAKREPFVELLAADTLEISRDAQPKQLVPDVRLMGSLGMGLASLGVLIWLVLAGPGYLGHGASLIWTGAGHVAGPIYDIARVCRAMPRFGAIPISWLQPN